MAMEPSRHIEHPYRVRFDEADADGKLRPSGFVRYAQDMAWRHSEEAGFDRAWYDDRSMHWLVRNVEVHLMGAVGYGEQLSIGTEVTGWRHVWARRHTEIRRDDAADEVVATVDTDWVLLGDDGRRARVPDELTRFFSADETFRRNRVMLPEPHGEPTRLATRVRPLDIDPLRHMNNAAYLDFVDDGLKRMAGLPTRGPDCYRLGYVRPALPDSAVNVACWPTDEGPVACRIANGEGDELTRVLVSWTGA
jgi:acyl-ACP thioesterase